MQVISCPQCQHEFKPPDLLREQIRNQFREEMSIWKKQKEESFQAREAQLNRQLAEKEIEFIKKREEDRQRLAQQIEQELQKSMSTQYEAKLQYFEEKNQQQEQALKEAQATSIELLRVKEELRQKENAMALEMERALMQERERIREQIKNETTEWQKRQEQDYQLKIAELEKQLDSQRKLADEMKRKAEQGSMQLQGKVQEISLENLLRQAFPYDLIDEVGKGVRGADCIQTVNGPYGQPYGKIIFESKRTKEFSMDWVDKLKDDMRNLGADVAVIVTQTMPKGMKGFGQIDGVWVCHFFEVRAVTEVLRDLITKVYMASRAQENKGDKMTLLYEYLISAEFAEQWKAIREGFMSMRLSLQKERNQMEKLWKAREKQLDRVLLNAAQIKGSIEGISGMEQLDFDLIDEEQNQGLLD